MSQWECLVVKKVGDDVSGNFGANAGGLPDINRFGGFAQFSDNMNFYTGDQTKFDTNWIPNDTVRARGNPSTNVIDFTYNAISVNGSIAFDLWSHGIFPSDTNWTLRFKLNFATLVEDTNTVMYIGLSDKDQSAGSSDSQDGIFLKPRFTSGRDWRFVDVDNTDLNGAGAGDLINAEDPLTSTDYFCELKRTSDITFEATIFVDSNYSVVRFKGKTSTVVGIVDLRFIKITNANLTQVGNMTGTVDDVQFFNDTEGTFTDLVLHGDEDLTPPSVFLPGGATKVITGADDANWVVIGGITVSGGIINGWFNGGGGVNRRAGAYDLDANDGITLDDLNWTIDFEFERTDNDTNPSALPFTVQADPFDIDPTNNSGNTFGIGFKYGLNVVNGQKAILIFSNGSGDFGTPADSNHVTNDPSQDIFIAQNVPVFMRLMRINGTKIVLEVYTDSNRTTLLGRLELNGVPSTINTLTWINSANSTNAGMGRIINGTLRDIRIFNGVAGAFDGGIILDEDFSTYGTPVNPNFTDSFDSATGWTTTDSTRVRIEDDQGFLFMMAVADLSNDAIAFDLGATVNPGPNIVSDTEWILRYKISFQVVDDGASSANKSVIVGLFDGDQTVDSSVNQDCICQIWLLDNTKAELRLVRTNNAVPEDNANVDKTILNIITTRTFYTELKRTGSNSYEMSIYDDAQYSNLINRQVGTLSLSGIINLRYLKVLNEVSQNGAGQLDATIDDIQFWDGRSTTCDVDVANPWITTDSDLWDVEICQENIQYRLEGDGTTGTDVLSLDLGNPLATQWVMRWVQTVLEFDDSDTVSIAMYVGLSDNDDGRDTVQDSIFMTMVLDFNGPTQFRTHVTNGTNIGGGVQGTIFTFVPQLGKFYWELIRLSNTQIQLSLFSDENYTFLIETRIETINANIVSLQFVKLIQGSQVSTNFATGQIDDIKIWDGVDVADSFDARRYLQVLTTGIGSSGFINWEHRYNLDNEDNYANRQSFNGGADTTFGNQTFAHLLNLNAQEAIFGDTSIYNRLDDVKIVQTHIDSIGIIGSSNPPNRIEVATKWANQLTKISRISIINSSSGVLDTDTEAVVFGSE